MLPANIERNNIDAGHGRSCAYAACGECTCGKYIWESEEEDLSFSGPEEIPSYTKEELKSYSDDDLPF